MDRDKDDQTAANQPVDVIRDQNLKAAIWRNESEKGPFYATTFSRTYKDQDGQYRDTNSFVAGDLLRLSELARKTYDRTTELRREDREQERGPDEGRQSRREAFREERGGSRTQARQPGRSR